MIISTSWLQTSQVPLNDLTRGAKGHLYFSHPVEISMWPITGYHILLFPESLWAWTTSSCPPLSPHSKRHTYITCTTHVHVYIAILENKVSTLVLQLSVLLVASCLRVCSQPCTKCACPDCTHSVHNRGARILLLYHRASHKVTVTNLKLAGAGSTSGDRFLHHINSLHCSCKGIYSVCNPGCL